MRTCKTILICCLYLSVFLIPIVSRAELLQQDIFSQSIQEDEWLSVFESESKDYSIVDDIDHQLCNEIAIEYTSQENISRFKQFLMQWGAYAYIKFLSLRNNLTSGSLYACQKIRELFAFH